MFCKNCGAQLQEGNLFCPMCGTNNAENATEDNQETEVQKTDALSGVKNAIQGFGAKKIGIIAAAVVVVIVLFAVIAGGSSKGMSVSKKSPEYVGKGYFMDANGNAKEFDDVYNSYASADHSVVLYLDYDYSLYLVDKDLKAKEIASDVTNVLVGKEGKYVAYLSNEDEDYYSQTLYIYNVSKGKSNKIDDEVYGDYLTISVSGESVAYIKDYDNGEFDTYVAGYSKEPKKISSDKAKPVAVSDNAKKAYCVDNDSTLYYFNGKDEEKVTSGVSGAFWTNSDLSELVFSKDGDTYFCKPGKDKEKLGKTTICNIVYPVTYGVCYVGNNTQALLNDTIKGQVIYGNDNDLYWVNKKATDMVELDKNVSNIQMSEDGSSVAYVAKQKVYKLNKFKADAEPKLLYDDEDIYYIAASADLKKVYGYAYDDDTVYYFKNSKKAVKISEDVDSMAFNYNNGKLYLAVDEELYEAKTSESSKKKVSVDGDVYSVYSSLNGVLVYSEDGSDNVCSFIGKKMTTVYED